MIRVIGYINNTFTIIIVVVMIICEHALRVVPCNLRLFMIGKWCNDTWLVGKMGRLFWPCLWLRHPWHRGAVLIKNGPCLAGERHKGQVNHLTAFLQHWIELHIAAQTGPYVYSHICTVWLIRKSFIRLTYKDLSTLWSLVGSLCHLFLLATAFKWLQSNG